jgi:SAM-dependent methyltransferase
MSKSLVQQQFGARAAAYATSPVHARGASLKRLVELTKPEKHWVVLDVATGAGHTAAAFAPHVAHVIAADITEPMLEEARKLAASKGLANVETAYADAEALPFEHERFHLVTCRIAPHHFGDIPAFLAEVHRVLKGGGLFALVDNVAPDSVSTPGFSDAELDAAARAYNAFEKERDPSHERACSTTEWARLLMGVGLRIEHQELLLKESDAAAWAQRMGVDAARFERLRAQLSAAPPALAAFLRPRVHDGRLFFTHTEGVFIARKPG